MSSAIKVWEYQGKAVHARPDEKINLTDMWRAAGADPSRQPAKFLSHEGTLRFVGHLKTLLGKESLVETKEGRGGGTWAHWHLALDYASYLDDDFHVWCNEVIRREMQRAPAEPIARLDAAVVNSARIGNDETAKRALRRGVTRVCRARGYSVQRVIGFVRRAYCVSSPWAISLHLLEKVLGSLQDIEDGIVSLLTKREQRRLEAAGKPAQKQLPLALKGLN